MRQNSQTFPPGEVKKTPYKQWNQLNNYLLLNWVLLGGFWSVNSLLLDRFRPNRKSNGQGARIFSDWDDFGVSLQTESRGKGRVNVYNQPRASCRCIYLHLCLFFIVNVGKYTIASDARGNEWDLFRKNGMSFRDSMTNLLKRWWDFGQDSMIWLGFASQFCGVHIQVAP